MVFYEFVGLEIGDYFCSRINWEFKSVGYMLLMKQIDSIGFQFYIGRGKGLDQG